MATEKKKKNKKKKKSGIKKPVSMVLKQNFKTQKTDTEARREAVYQAFRARCETKSDHAYVDRGDEPELLRLYLLGTKFNSTVEFLVKFKSFKPIMGNSEGTQDQEIGFQVELKSPLIEETIVLEVMRRQFKATLIIPG